jgi:hypothetical protein
MFDEPPGSYDICKICFWEDDVSQLRFPRTSGANRLSLIEAQNNFVRPVSTSYEREREWRPIDLRRDNIEEPVSGVDSGATYPSNDTLLYYWRPTYWRREK